MAKLHDDWIEFLKLLRANRVRFVIVGAHAVAAHGRPRLTGDLDLLLEPTLQNGRAVVQALEQFGFSGLDARSITQPDTVVFLGREPFRIDLLTSIDGVTWKAAWAGRLRSTLGGVSVAFLGFRQLLRNKRAAGRPKDLADVALLMERKQRRVTGKARVGAAKRARGRSVR
jgi:hypothetical protein